MLKRIVKLRFQFDRLMNVRFSVYALEALLKVLGLGITKYFGSGWNVFDFTVTLLALSGVLVLSVAPSFTYIVILRPLRYKKK